MVIAENVLKHYISTFIYFLDQKILFNEIHALFRPILVTLSTFYNKNGNFLAKKDYFYLVKSTNLF